MADSVPVHRLRRFASHVCVVQSERLSWLTGSRLNTKCKWLYQELTETGVTFISYIKSTSGFDGFTTIMYQMSIPAGVVFP